MKLVMEKKASKDRMYHGVRESGLRSGRGAAERRSWGKSDDDSRGRAGASEITSRSLFGSYGRVVPSSNMRKRSVRYDLIQCDDDTNKRKVVKTTMYFPSRIANATSQVWRLHSIQHQDGDNARDR